MQRAMKHQMKVKVKKKPKSLEKNNNNVEASELWMNRRKQVESSNESDKDDEGDIHRHVPSVMETGAMMRIASIIERSKNSKHDSDNGNDDLESNYEKTKYRKKKKKKNKKLE